MYNLIVGLKLFGLTLLIFYIIVVDYFFLISYNYCVKSATVAQLVEQPIRNQQVGGSSPPGSSIDLCR